MRPTLKARAHLRSERRRRSCRRTLRSVREVNAERVADAQCEARPYRPAEIERHPRDLFFPLGEVVRHDPTRAHVTEPVERAQKLAASSNPGAPSPQVHGDVDGHEKRQIAGDPDNRGDEGDADRAIEFRQQAAKAGADHEKGNGPYRILDRVAEVVGGQHRIPREAFRDEDQRHDHPCGVQRRVRSRHRAQLVQDDRPLRRETDLGHGRDRPADDNARQPRVEQADPLDVRARQERPEGAAENIGRAEEQHELGPGRAAERPGRAFEEVAVEQKPNRDIGPADQAQKAPPPSHGIRPGQGPRLRQGPRPRPGPRPPFHTHEPLLDRPLRVTGLTCDRSNFVTNCGRSRQKCVRGGGAAWECLGRCRSGCAKTR